jgi:hypothetical protein
MNKLLNKLAGRYRKKPEKAPRSKNQQNRADRYSSGKQDSAEGAGKLVFNQKCVGRDQLVRQLAAILEEKALQAVGGILFKAGTAEDAFHLSLIPNFYEGERGYHYNIHIPCEDEFTLIGGISPQRELTILFKNREVDDAARDIYRRNYRMLVQLLLESAGEQPFAFDWITVQLLREQEIFPTVPETLEDLA